MTAQLTGLTEQQITANLTAALITAYRLLLEGGTTPTTVHVELELALMQAGVDICMVANGVPLSRPQPTVRLAYAAGRGEAQ